MGSLKYATLAAALALTACGGAPLETTAPPPPPAYETRTIERVPFAVEVKKACLSGAPPEPPPQAQKQATLSASAAAIAAEVIQLRRIVKLYRRLLRACE